MITHLQILLASFPLLLIFYLGTYFPVNNSFQPIFQPPNYLFPIVWTYLLTSFGIVSSLIIDQVYLFYIIILTLLSSWLVVNFYQLYRLGFYLLLKTTLIAMIYVCYLFYLRYSYLGILILPLPCWLVLASCLNAVIYQHYYANSFNLNKL